MKNIMVAAAVLAMAAPAMASKARLQALGGSAHLSDTRNALARPAQLGADHVTFEMGPTAPGANNAEGGFVRSTGDARWGLYLGNHDTLNTRPAGYLTNENPIDFAYAAKAGDMDWGVGLAYSSSDYKSNDTKQSYMALKGGVVTGPWEVNVQLGLTDTATNVAGDKVTGAASINLLGSYTVDSNFYYANFKTYGGKEEDTAGNEIGKSAHTDITLGYVNSTKSDGVDFFYGVALTQEKESESKADAMMLPFLVGLEADANSWLTLRASVTQNVLLGSTKVVVGTDTKTDSIANNTVVAAGAGIKWGKAILDGTLAGSNTGDINGNNLLANAALTYNF